MLLPYSNCNPTTTDFLYSGSTLLETLYKWYNGNTENVRRLWYIYDDTGSMAGVRYNGTDYYYVKNAQGDVEAILNAEGTAYAEYRYDSWGKVIVALNSNGGTNIENTIAGINQIGYRGYFYDRDTGLYYLGSRFYDPETGRFISADGYLSTGQGITGYNMFAYCGDDPISKVDPYGEWECAISPDESITDLLREAFCAALGIVAGYMLGTAAGTVIRKTVLDVPAPIPWFISKNNEKVQDDAEAIAITKTLPPKKQAVFPDNPDDFNPKGLIRNDYAGSSNGSFIKWFIPGTKMCVFEWDEDLKNGPHYHIGEKPNPIRIIHFHAQEPIPEPWNSLYF